MQTVTSQNFGLLIAYLLPGFVALSGVAEYSPTLRLWLGRVPQDAPSIGGFLYATLASIGAGLIVSTVRWLVIDTLHHWTGVRRGNWDFSRLQENVAAFDVLGENHYRYYQAYGNGAVAVAFWYLARWTAAGLWSPPLGWGAIGVLLLEVLLLAGSRDTIRRYYDRMSKLLSSTRATRKDRSPRQGPDEETLLGTRPFEG